ncbi:pyridoxal-phosphate dependent enzyme [Auritidibacter ignavus]|uniref:pyridoxal-phosphate dependent enzyme n=1 Tax=Auritidibacter ignavus TaxID=678932 RepID=UPI0024BB401F|nr:pyridoxal-phosphate dependent enzyme [Auritidibacter ignavus]WHS36135.1 pyridoxal-phosphate dependent enzyme [Auritidibacter ignavus]
MRYAQNVLDLIGSTPLVKLNSVAKDVQPTILAKLEYLNPGGSVKDRIALKMIERAESEGKLAPGGTVVEPTSGNTGVGLALVAQQKGYRSVFVTPDKVGAEKRDVLKAYGADVMVSQSAVAPDSEESYYGIANRLEESIPGAYQPNQFFNPAAPESHYETTGPEIWKDTAGAISHLVVSAGTGGTMTGTGRYLKDVSAQRQGGPVKIVVADPDGSVYSGGAGRPYYVEGVGEDMWPDNYDPDLPDAVYAITDAEAFAMTRRLAAEEGLLVGGSSGMAVVAALREAEKLSADDVLVVILPDSGRGYLGKIFSDTWMSTRGFSTGERTPVIPDRLGTAYRDGLAPHADNPKDRASDTADSTAAEQQLDETTVAELLDDKHSWLPGSLPEVVTARTETTVGEAISIMNRYGIDTLPVVSASTADIRVNEVRGMITTATLMDGLAQGRFTPADPVGTVKLDQPVLLGARSSLSDARLALATTSAVIATRDGLAVGIMTHHDLLMFLSPR